MAGPTFALLHGGGQGSWVWRELIDALTIRSADCLTLDVPGCGTKRGRDTSAIEFDDIATELVADLEAAGVQDVVLVGHSQGGQLIPRMVERASGLFGRLIYVTCSAAPPGRSILELIGNQRRGDGNDQVGFPLDPATTPLGDQFRAMFCNDMSSTDQDAFLAKLGQDNWPLSSYTHRDWRYAHLSSFPSTFVLCGRDMALTPAWQERFAATLRVTNTVRIDAGHQVMNSQPEALAVRIGGWNIAKTMAMRVSEALAWAEFTVLLMKVSSEAIVVPSWPGPVP